MAAQEPQSITLLLQHWSSGDPTALAAITPIVYHQLVCLITDVAGNVVHDIIA
ncbi:MAG: hypothetical protein NTW74_14155 [Acidobacteria bacterium]|nr:hypothetical protein [Acidobacteriota bacterium]